MEGKTVVVRAAVAVVVTLVLVLYGLRLLSTGVDRKYPRVVPPASIPPSTHDDELRFLVIGDFGTGVVPGFDFHQHEVAATLTHAAEEHKPSFVMTTGDIIYSNGIRSDQDPQIQEKFFTPYAAPSLQVPWHIIPGNHDCRGSVAAMLDVASLSPQWHMPARYYAEQFVVGGATVRILYLDTCLLVCGSMSNFRCEDSMLPNLSVEEKEEEYAWLDRELAVAADWKLVVGHWSIFSLHGNGPTPELIDELLPRLVKHGVQAYFNGHDHSLQHLVYRPAVAASSASGQQLHLFVSGGGGYETQPQLKSEARGDLNAGVGVEFSRGMHGFMKATLTRCTLEIAFVDVQGGTPHVGRVARKC
ncbi:hypothetical protein PTSG_07838 [Salpingoeca rosetta]|uniref:acid phosphatase n=1 Tax=Salpingoeca rosetta (strain ATCC 50818 / BSB-021) TaxID=946362 RepID=F2UGH2_SALR5|nr:uncharacterized protein PTSG_07838 [Salpingoeca rosetta]EGD75722.1 hypothetical protein PTSG_07838 [Salpingoeca rosetta]|eukprot:XP_004991643.1 hypothetical protein PTSG_07838 [Salpingoeca rosetta]